MTPSRLSPPNAIGALPAIGVLATVLTTAAITTAVILALSAYAHKTGKDFSLMAGFLIVVILASIAAIFIPAMQAGISAAHSGASVADLFHRHPSLHPGTHRLNGFDLDPDEAMAGVGLTGIAAPALGTTHGNQWRFGLRRIILG